MIIKFSEDSLYCTKMCLIHILNISHKQKDDVMLAKFTIRDIITYYNVCDSMIYDMTFEDFQNSSYSGLNIWKHYHLFLLSSFVILIFFYFHLFSIFIFLYFHRSLFSSFFILIFFRSKLIYSAFDSSKTYLCFLNKSSLSQWRWFNDDIICLIQFMKLCWLLFWYIHLFHTFNHSFKWSNDLVNNIQNWIINLNEFVINDFAK